MAQAPNPTVDPQQAEGSNLEGLFHSRRMNILVATSHSGSNKNPKPEIRNPKQIRNSKLKWQKRRRADRFEPFQFPFFQFVSDARRAVAPSQRVGFRISDLSPRLEEWT
jgi:hypothetical protein